MKANWFLSLAALCVLALTSCAKEGEATAETTTPAVAPTATTTTAPPATTTAAAEVPVGPTTTMEFEEMEFDFGQIDMGEKVQHVYTFKNTGKEPLVISNAKGTCGCTVPQWPKEPIAPGEGGEIHVEFNSKGKSGPQRKNVILTANTNPQKTTLTIKGNVNKTEEPAAANG